MDEIKAQADSGTVSSSGSSSEEGMRKSVEAEIQEMEKYKWCLGVQLRHDPLNDRSLNDIYCEWIDKYAAEFRKSWEKKKRENLQNTE